jgi:hypothetical protein
MLEVSHYLTSKCTTKLESSKQYRTDRKAGNGRREAGSNDIQDSSSKVGITEHPEGAHGLR